MNKIFQGSVAIRTMLGGLTIFFQLQISCSVYVPKIMKVDKVIAIIINSLVYFGPSGIYPVPQKIVPTYILLLVCQI